jgi:hypothetical protein
MTTNNAITLARLDAIVQAQQAFMTFIRPIMIDSRITHAEFTTYLSLKMDLENAIRPVASQCDRLKQDYKVTITTPETVV